MSLARPREGGRPARSHWARRGWAILVPAALLGACGLDVTGAPGTVAGAPDAEVDTGTSPASDAGSTDALAIDRDVVVAPGCECEGALATGWTRVGHAAARTTPCPLGYDAFDVVADPTAGSGACTCGTDCIITAPPSCAGGVVTSSVGTGCTTPGVSMANNPPGACGSFGSEVVVASNVRVNPPPPSGGTCTTTATSNHGALGATPSRLCVATSSACPATALCDGNVTGVSECVVHDGDVPCPGAPFVRRTVVGSAATLTCTASCGCSVTATCTGSLGLFENSGCGGQATTLTADGQCRNASSSSVRSYRYTGTVAASSCRGTGTSSARVALADTKTLCCR